MFLTIPSHRAFHRLERALALLTLGRLQPARRESTLLLTVER
jgi:hypothetical protein